MTKNDFLEKFKQYKEKRDEIMTLDSQVKGLIAIYKRDFLQTFGCPVDEQMEMHDMLWHVVNKMD